MLGLGIYIFIAAQNFGYSNPIKDGFDALIEFPPHVLSENIPAKNSELPILNPNYQGKIMDYMDVVHAATTVKATSFPLFRTVFSILG